MRGVHAVTDVTGFGLLGHALEICRGSGLGATIAMRHVPLLPRAAALAEAGFITGASGRNWTSYGEAVHLPDGLPDIERALLCDPQTSGGLLIAVSPDAAADLLAHVHAAGFAQAAVIGAMRAGSAAVEVK
jgi:selenide,water dikinase